MNAVRVWQFRHILYFTTVYISLQRYINIKYNIISTRCQRDFLSIPFVRRTQWKRIRLWFWSKCAFFNVFCYEDAAVMHTHIIIVKTVRKITIFGLQQSIIIEILRNQIHINVTEDSIFCTVTSLFSRYYHCYNDIKIL